MSRKDNRFFNQFAILTACFFAFLGFLSIKTAIASLGDEMQKVEPYPLPAITYLDENGQKTTLEAHQGKVMVIHFWASWCPPCVQEMPRMEKLVKSLEDSQFVVIPLSLDATKEAITQFNDAQKLDLPLWQDAGNRALSALKLRGLPSTVVVDHKGQVVAMREGPVSWQSGELRSLLWNMIEASKRKEEAAKPIPSAMSAPESHKSE